MDLQAQLEQPLEMLLSTGGDSRQITGAFGPVNKYLCSMKPRPEVAPLGSCTASSISGIGYQAADRLHSHLRALVRDTDIRTALAEQHEIIRQEILFLLTQCSLQGVEVALAPSGTDAELLALALAHGSGKQPVTNILLAPAEVGSGTPQAAACQYFDELSPAGNSVVVGSAVDTEMAERTSVLTVDIRDKEGDARSETDIDAEVEGIIAERVSLGHKVLLHVVSHSKTGLHAPSMSCIDGLRSRFGEDVLVMIDAAQGRFSRRGLLRVLKAGHLVLITGSKFFGGPPFSGALLVPANAAPPKRGLTELPRGFSNFFTQDQMPHSWGPQSTKLPETGNIGLLLRWAAATVEIREYYSTPSKLRLQVLREFERVVPKELNSSSLISLETTAEPVLSDLFDRVLQSKTTVFSFGITPSNGSRLNTDGLKQVWHWLNQDISHLLPDTRTEIRESLAAKFHLGQPVKLAQSSSAPAVLRVALGGVLISSVAYDPKWGLTYQRRVERLHETIFKLKTKIEAIATHYDELILRSD